MVNMAIDDLPTFGSEEWAGQLKNYLNNNPNYVDSAKSWEGALVLEFLSEGIKLEQDVYIWLDLWHGECRDVKFMSARDELETAYYITATESMWAGLVSGTINPQTALMAGKFKMSGDMGKLMRYPKSAGYIIKYLKRLLENW
jgi:putative sterol carrier protein